MPTPIAPGTLVAFEYTETRRTDSHGDATMTGPATEDATRWRWAVGSVVAVNPHGRLVTLGCWDAPRRDTFVPQDERTAFEIERAISKDEAALQRKRDELVKAAADIDAAAKTVTERSRETSAELEAVRPALEEAVAGLAKLSTDNLRELRSYTTPPEHVRKVLDGVTRLLGTPADSWAEMRAFVRSEDMLPNIRAFNPESVTPEAKDVVDKYLADPTFTYDRCVRASKATGPMYQWLVAQVNFAAVWHKVAPLVKELNAHREELKALELQKTSGTAEAAAIEERLRKLRDEYDQLLYGETTTLAADVGFAPDRSRAGLWHQRVDGRERRFVILRSSILRVLASHTEKVSGTYMLAVADAPKPADDAESAEAALQRKVDDLSTENVAQAKKLQRAEAALSSLEASAQGSSSDAARRVAELEDQVHDLLQRVGDEGSSKARMAEEAEAAKRQHQTTIDVLEDELTTAKASLDAERDGASKRIGSLQKRVADLEAQLTASRDQQQQGTPSTSGAVDADEHARLLDGVTALRSKLAEADERAEAAEAAARRAKEESAAASPVSGFVVEKATIATQTDDIPGDEDLEFSDDDDDVADGGVTPPSHVDPLNGTLMSNVSFNEAMQPPAESDDEGPPEPFTIFHGDLARAAEFICAFPVDKVVQATFTRKLRRTWVVDCFAGQVHNCDGKGLISKSFDVKKLAMVERDESDPRHLRLLFSAVGHAHSLLFVSPYARERFVELVQLLRPAITSFCPELLPPLTEAGSSAAGRTHTEIDITGCPEVEVDVVGGKVTAGGDAPGRKVICDVSSQLHETLTFWIGTHNLDSSDPADDPSVLDTWLPRGAADIYCIALQNTRGHPEEVYEVLERHLGQGVLRASSIELEEFGIGMLLLVRRTALAKFSNCEGSKALLDDHGHGALALSFSALDTKVNIVSAYLPAKASAGVRGEMLRGALSRLQVGVPDSDVTTNAHHVFVTGELGYGLLCDQTELSRCVGNQDYGRLLRADGLSLMRRAAPSRPLAAFYESTVHFPPTAFTERGAGYLSRVLHYSPGHAPLPYRDAGDDFVGPDAPPLRCVAYGPSEEMVVSPYLAVAAMYRLRVRRTATAILQASHTPTYKVTVSNVTMTLDVSDKVDSADLAVRSPSVRMTCPIGGSIMAFKKAGDAGGSALGGWKFSPAVSNAAAMVLTTNVQPVIDAEVMTFTLLDDNCAAGSRAVAAASVPLRDLIGPHAANAANRPARFAFPLIRRGGVVGACVGNLYWEKSSVSLTDSMM